VADDQGDELPDQGGGGGGSTSPGGGGGGGGGCSTCPPGWTLGSKLDPDTGDQIPWCFNPFGGPGQAPTCGPPTGGGDCVTVNGQEVCEPTCPGEGDDTIPTDLPPVDETWEVGCGAAYELCKSNCTNAGGTWEDDPGGNSGTCTLPDNGSGVSPFRCKIPSNAPPACFPDRKSAEAFVEAQKALGKDFWVTGTGTQVRGMGGIQIPIDKSCGAAPGCNDCAPGEMNPPENEAAVPEGGEQRGYICNPDNYGLYGDNIVTGGEYSQRIQDYMAWRVGDAASEAYNSTDTGSIISRSLLWAATAFRLPAPTPCMPPPPTRRC
jgi:hypothetical protein